MLYWTWHPAKFQPSIWKLKPTNQGFFEAQNSRIWAPDTQ